MPRKKKGDGPDGEPPVDDGLSDGEGALQDLNDPIQRIQARLERIEQSNESHEAEKA